MRMYIRRMLQRTLPAGMFAGNSFNNTTIDTKISQIHYVAFANKGRQILTNLQITALYRTLKMKVRYNCEG